MPAGWPLNPGCLSQISSAHAACDMERPRLQQLEAGIVERPFDLDRHAEHVFGLRIRRPSVVAWPAEARRAHQRLRHHLRQCRRREGRPRDDACGRRRSCARNRGG